MPRRRQQQQQQRNPYFADDTSNDAADLSQEQITGTEEEEEEEEQEEEEELEERILVVKKPPLSQRRLPKKAMQQQQPRRIAHPDKVGTHYPGYQHQEEEEEVETTGVHFSSPSAVEVGLKSGAAPKPVPRGTAQASRRELVVEGESSPNVLQTPPVRGTSGKSAKKFFTEKSFFNALHSPFV